MEYREGKKNKEKKMVVQTIVSFAYVFSPLHRINRREKGGGMIYREKEREEEGMIIKIDRKRIMIISENVMYANTLNAFIHLLVSLLYVRRTTATRSNLNNPV